MTSLLRTMMTGKIHRATVTQADLHYVGSITVDADLLAAADVLPGQQVDVVDVTNGARLTTYAIAGEPGSGQVCVNGAAAHLVHPGTSSSSSRTASWPTTRHGRTSRASCSSTSRTGSPRSATTPARCPRTGRTSSPAGCRWPQGRALVGRDR